MDNQVEFDVKSSAATGSCCGWKQVTSLLCCKPIVIGLLLVSFASIALAAFLVGRSQNGWQSQLPPEFLRATATHGGVDMAIATAAVDEENEAIFFLDYKTGDLTCYVYYTQFSRFGAKYTCNVTDQLAATKNAEYLLVSGRMQNPPASSNTRLARSLIYVVDTKSGQFAAYGIPINRAMQSAGQMQVGPILFVGGGEVRAPSAGSARRTIPSGADPAAPADPNAAPPPPARKPNNR